MSTLWVSRREMTCNGEKVIPGQIMQDVIGRHPAINYSGGGMSTYHQAQFTGEPGSLVSCKCGQRFVSDRAMAQHKEIVHKAQPKPEGPDKRIPPARTLDNPEMQAAYDGWRARLIALNEAMDMAAEERVKATNAALVAKSKLRQHVDGGDPRLESFYHFRNVFQFEVDEAAKAETEAIRRLKELQQSFSDERWGERWASTPAGMYEPKPGRKGR